MLLKKGFYKIKEGSLGLAERGGVGEKRGVISKDISKEACKL
jgi:hypothetical protein